MWLSDVQRYPTDQFHFSNLPLFSRPGTLIPCFFLVMCPARLHHFLLDHPLTYSWWCKNNYKCKIRGYFLKFTRSPLIYYRFIPFQALKWMESIDFPVAALKGSNGQRNRAENAKNTTINWYKCQNGTVYMFSVLLLLCNGSRPLNNRAVHEPGWLATRMSVWYPINSRLVFILPFQIQVETITPFCLRPDILYPTWCFIRVCVTRTTTQTFFTNTYAMLRPSSCVLLRLVGSLKENAHSRSINF